MSVRGLGRATQGSNGRSRRGFTLIELMVVILILAILAALIVPKVVGKQDQAKVAAAHSDISTLSTLLNNFRIDCDRYPTTEEGLQALITPPAGLENKWKGPYTDKIPLDPWGHEYQYTFPGATGQDSFTIMSYGQDGQQGGDGYATDITNND